MLVQITEEATMWQNNCLNVRVVHCGARRQCDSFQIHNFNRIAKFLKLFSPVYSVIFPVRKQDHSTLQKVTYLGTL